MHLESVQAGSKRFEFEPLLCFFSPSSNSRRCLFGGQLPASKGVVSTRPDSQSSLIDFNFNLTESRNSIKGSPWSESGPVMVVASIGNFLFDESSLKQPQRRIFSKRRVRPFIRLILSFIRLVESQAHSGPAAYTNTGWLFDKRIRYSDRNNQGCCQDLRANSTVLIRAHRGPTGTTTLNLK